MKKNILLLLVMLLPAMGLQAQIINKSNKDKIGQDIKNGFHSTLEAIKQDAHPSGEHSLWDAYAGPRLGLGVSSLPGAGGAPELGVVAGGFFEVYVAKNIGLSFDITFQHRGGNNVHHAEMVNVTDESGNVTGQVLNSGKYNYNLNYITTDYLIHWYPWPYRPVSFYSGLQLSKLASANCRRKGGSKDKIHDELFEGEISIPVGATYEWKQWEFDARYDISLRKLSKTHKARQILGNAHDMMLALTVAYRIQIF